MHPCGHSSIKFCGHVTLGLKIHFSYLSQPSVSKTCSFINSCLYPSPFWVFGKNFHSIHPSCVHTFFSKKPCVLIGEFFQRKIGVYFFLKESWLFSQKYIYFFVFVCFFYEVFCYLNTYIFLWGILLPKHIHTYSKYFCYLNIYIYFVRYWLPSQFVCPTMT